MSDQRAAHPQIRGDQGVDRFVGHLVGRFDHEVILPVAPREFVFDGVARHMAVALHPFEGFLER